MDLMCLIKLLLEKEYIKEAKTFRNDGNIIVKSYSYKVREIVDKIKNSNYDKENIYIDFGNLGSTFVLINKNHLKEYILKGNRNEIFFDRSTRGFCQDIISNSTIVEIFKNDCDIDIETVPSGARFKIKNLKLIREREQKAKKEREEILDFLDRLP